MKITWIGHSCFKIESFGASIITDPYADDYVPGLKPVRETANIVLCSHGHGDHNAVECVTIQENPQNPFTIKKIESFHDDTNGSQRGTNTIHIIDDGDFKLVHFGDQGCQLSKEQIEALSGVDIALIPVGGFYTVNAKEAFDILESIKPNLIIPMHYKRDSFGFDVISGVEDFAAMYEHVNDLGRTYIETDEISGYRPMVYILTPQNA